MHKNIINGRRSATAGGAGSGSGNTGFEHLTISEPWISDLGDTEVFTVELFKQESLVTMIMPRVALDMQGVANWRRASLIPVAWAPQNYAATSFPAATNINSTVGRYEYDSDVVCAAEVTPNGSVILWREAPPGTGTWQRPDDTSRVGWNSFSLQWVIVQPD